MHFYACQFYTDYNNRAESIDVKLMQLHNSFGLYLGLLLNYDCNPPVKAHSCNFPEAGEVLFLHMVLPKGKFLKRLFVTTRIIEAITMN